MLRASIHVLAALFLAAPAFAQTTWHVDDDACPGPGSGTPDDPFCSIQAGIDAAADGDTVIVEPGIYPPIDIEKAITVRSTDPIDAAVVSSTIISGGWIPTTCVRVVAAGGPGPVLSGFSITGGYTGMLVQGSATVTHCVSHGNTIGVRVFLGSPTVTHCVFRENADWMGRGGGMHVLNNATPAVTNCSFIDNRAEAGGAIMFFGDGDQVLTNCSFVGNTAEWGGAICISPYASGGFHAQSCTFTDNMALEGEVAYGGGSSYASLTNCVVWGNGLSYPTFRDFDIWVTAHHSLLSDDYEVEGEGNISADPMFVDPLNGDYRLQAGSPAIDAGDSSRLPADESDVDGDGDVDEPLPLDLGGDPRVVGASVDMGAYEFQGSPCPADLDGSGAVDFGDLLAVLSAWGACDDCLEDLDGDGMVDFGDVLVVLAAWGPCA